MNVDGTLDAAQEPRRWYQKAWSVFELALGAVLLTVGGLFLLIAVGGLFFATFGWWSLGIVLGGLLYVLGAVEW